MIGNERRIRSFARLEDGWHYSEGVAIDHEAVTVCLRMNAVFEQLWCSTNAFPMMRGGVLLTVYQQTEYLEIEIYDGNQEIAYELIDDR